ncbi:MAG: hypothetical protein AUJ57_03775 [Zetaproteobacteria bacterium CG1_02_53_45]|nr:MAG: hypothetical protein AUJ57_03775 [Zetaproteobacteria bacterium CG1_02_53_45]
MGVYNESGERVGYLLMNYLAGAMLDRFRASAALILGDELLVDSSAMVLSSPDPLLQWHKLDDQPCFTPVIDTAASWQAMSTAAAGLVERDAVTYVYATVHPALELSDIPMLKNHPYDSGYFWNLWFGLMTIMSLRRWENSRS